MCFSVYATLGSGSVMKTSPPLSSTTRAAFLLSAALLFFAGSGCPPLHSQTQPTGGAPADAAYDPALFAGLEYRMIGPHRGGRVTAVAGHTAHPHTFYMGPTGGGVWRTTDAGQTWEPLTDGTLPVGSIGAIDVADSNPDVIYVGTGSAAIRSNVSIGKGVWKSTDRGETWSFAGLPEVGQIGELIVHPQDPNTVWLAAVGNPFAPNPERGVFRTRDGGTSWEKVLFVSDSTGASDIAINPRNPNEIYAGMWRAERKPWTIISGAMEGGVYKSTDGGDSWTELTNGLPAGLTGKISVSVSPANPNRVYALIEAVEPEEGLYRSDDAGASWQLINGDEEGLLRRPFYYTYVDAHPTDPEVVWVNNEGFYKSVDGGKTFERKPTPHGDNHGMWINPENPDIIVQSNDGGANVSLNGGESWSTQLNQPTAELYQANVDDRFPYWVYAGQQDNTTIGVPSLPPTASAPDASLTWWRQIGGCETGPAVPKPGTEGQIVYSNCKGRFGRYNALTGQEKQFYVGAEYMYGTNPAELEYRFQRVSPIYVSPHDPNTVYHASQFLHRTTDGGTTWETISPDLTWNPPHAQVISGAPITRDITGEEVYSTLYAIGESALERGVLWAGSNDGLIHVSRDNGATWTDVTPEGLPEGGRVQTVDPSPHRAGSAYIAVLRYMLDDWEPYIFRTDDYGQSWTRLTTTSNGMGADNPTRVVREDPEHEGLLYAGTEYGMWISWDNGARWQPLQLNLPHTPITDIKVNEGDLVLSTQGRSFWVLDDVDPLRQFSPEVARARAHLFTPPRGIPDAPGRLPLQRCGPRVPGRRSIHRLLSRPRAHGRARARDPGSQWNRHPPLLERSAGGADGGSGRAGDARLSVGSSRYAEAAEGAGDAPLPLGPRASRPLGRGCEPQWPRRSDDRSGYLPGPAEQRRLERDPPAGDPVGSALGRRRRDTGRSRAAARAEPADPRRDQRSAARGCADRRGAGAIDQWGRRDGRQWRRVTDSRAACGARVGVRNRGRILPEAEADRSARISVRNDQQRRSGARAGCLSPLRGAAGGAEYEAGRAGAGAGGGAGGGDDRGAPVRSATAGRFFVNRGTMYCAPTMNGSSVCLYPTEATLARSRWRCA